MISSTQFNTKFSGMKLISDLVCTVSDVLGILSVLWILNHIVSAYHKWNLKVFQDPVILKFTISSKDVMFWILSINTRDEFWETLNKCLITRKMFG